MQALKDEYLVDGPYRLVHYDLGQGDDGAQYCTAKLRVPDGEVMVAGEGTGPIEAFVNGMVTTLNEPLNIVDYNERSLGAGKDAQAICIVQIGAGAGALSRGARGGSSPSHEDTLGCFGIGLSRNTVTAALTAIVSAVNRRWKPA